MATRTTRLMTCAFAMALSLTACQSDPEPQPETTSPPLPTASPTPTPNAEPTTSATTPAGLDPTDPEAVAAASVDATKDLLNSIWGLPVETTSAPDDVSASIETTTAADSPARKFADDQLIFALDPEIVLRGDILGEPLAPAELGDDGTFAIDACLSSLTTNATDEPLAEGIANSAGLYLVTPIEGQVVDGEVMLTQIIDADDPDPTDCVPQTLAADVTDAWRQFVDATVGYRRDTGNAAARADLARWVAPASDALAEFEYTVELEDTQVGLVLEQADRQTVQATYCQDSSLNPNAAVTLADGTVQPLPDIATESDWQQDGEAWRRVASSSYTEELRNQVPDLWERCFG